MIAFDMSDSEYALILRVCYVVVLKPRDGFLISVEDASLTEVP